MVNIDLYSGQFWWFVAVAVLVLIPSSARVLADGHSPR